MSTRSIKVCDFPTRNGGICGKEATVPVSAKLGNKNGANDVCAQHESDVAKAFEAIGLPFSTAKTKDSKSRKAMRTKSGKTFTTADAREWLVEQELLSPDARGRISKELTDAYAAAH